MSSRRSLALWPGFALLAGLSSPAFTAEERPTSSAPSFEDQVMELVNQQRLDNGSLPPLKRVDLLDNSSETHSSNMAIRNFFMHCDPDTGTSFGQRITAAGYAWNAAAENIGGGPATPASMVAAWMASASHRANILSSTYRELGIGYLFQSDDQDNVRQSPNSLCPSTFTDRAYFHYWTQDFGLRSNVYPVVIEREAFQTSNPQVELYLYGAGWALEMRLRNEAGTWAPWQPFSSSVNWLLSPGDGTKTVNVELRNGGTVRSASDTIVLAGSDYIFGDGFETGDTSGWSLTVS